MNDISVGIIVTLIPILLWLLIHHPKLVSVFEEAYFLRAFIVLDFQLAIFHWLLLGDPWR